MNDPAHPGPRYDALLELLRTSETLWHASRLFFARWDLSVSQFNILNLLIDLPAGHSQTELSRLLIMHRSNITGLVDRLEDRGLVKRRPLEDDRRAYRVVLTDKGAHLVRSILPHYYRSAEDVWQGIPAAHIQSLLKQFGRLRENIEKLTPSLSQNENES